MKKSGYTVAEAIITMAIIGVVASLTIPTFISSYKKNTYANTLSSAVSDFENAMQMIMVKDGVDDLLDTKAWNAIKSGTSYSLSNQTADGTIDKFKINIISFIRNSNKIFTFCFIKHNRTMTRYKLI